MDCKTANRMLVPFLEDSLTLEETDRFLKHMKECPGCREDLEIYYTVRTAIDGMDRDRLQTYDLKQQFELDMNRVTGRVRTSLFILRLHHILVTAACIGAGIAACLQITRWF